MSTIVDLDETTTAKARRPRGRWADRLLYGYTWAIIVWLCLPIAVMIAFGFNDTPGRYNQTWEGFTVKWYGRVFSIEALTSALSFVLMLVLLIGVFTYARILGTEDVMKVAAR